jgi:hypothetical protein
LFAIVPAPEVPSKARSFLGVDGVRLRALSMNAL